MINFAEIKKHINEIKAKNFDYGFDYIGIRVQEEPAIEGILNHQSVQWTNGEETDEKLNGVCAINVNDDVNHLINYQGYHGDWLLLLGSNNIEYGEDDGEIIMIDPYVIEILRKPWNQKPEDANGVVEQVKPVYIPSNLED